MFPERIVCLSGEAADICDRLGAGPRLVAVSAYAPKHVRQGRRVVAGFSTANLNEILKLDPDLVITFSDVQAEITADLIRNHCTVLATNQRTLLQIRKAILLIGRAIGFTSEAGKLADHFQQELNSLRVNVTAGPRVYFEEWDDPLTSGIGWVSEAIALAGGEDICARPGAHAARERVVDPAFVRGADPEIIFASWCGKPVDRARIACRDGWEIISAVRKNQIHALKSDDILQPGPAVLDGIRSMRTIIEQWRSAAMALCIALALLL